MTAALARYVCPRCGEVADRPGACRRDREELQDARDDELLGTEIGGYRVAEAIGRGGMGAVYRAVQATIDAEVAIKVLARELVGEHESSERFVNEARIANKVRHEGLVKVLFIGLLPDGRPYLIMEHLTGTPLSRLIGTVLPLGTLLRRLAEAIRAIAAMHDAGVIHRDLKPSNLFVTTAGYIKVLDFGIAKAADDRGLTRTGHTIGTPGYMSPEQAQAEPLDPRSDIYSLGVVLYEALVGERPFEGRVIEALASRELPPSLPVHLPQELDAIVRRAMAPDPAARFASAGAFAEALDAVVETLSPEQFGPLADAPLAITPVPTAPIPPTAPAAPTEVPPTQPARRPVERLGRYIVEGTLGRGGEGVVLVGRDPKVQRKVALKLLAADTADRRSRMIAEAQAMARVNHPNVVTLYELGEDGDQLFLAMEYLEAVDLEHWLAQQARTWRDILAMFIAAGRGLAAAHAAGVVHRDFKPANVLLGNDGRPRVGDFGIAGVEASTGDGAGTPAFMAPEQIDGVQLDARADQYAFCAALWHALHGEAPYAGTTAVAIAMAAKRGELRTPAREVPGTLTGVLRRGLAFEPAARFPDLPALLAALDRLATPRSRRRWLIVGGIGALGILAVVVAATRDPAPAEPEDSPAPSLAEIRALGDPMAQLRALARLPRYALLDPEVRALARDAMAHGRVETITLDVEPIANAASFARDGTLVVPTEGPTVAIAPDGSRHSLPAAPRTPRRVFLAEGELRVLLDDAILATPLATTSWRTVARCRAVGSRQKVTADGELARLACVGDGVVYVDGTAVSLALGDEDKVEFTPTGRIVVRRHDVLEMFDPRGTTQLARAPLGVSIDNLVARDDLVGWQEPGGFGWWDVRRNAVEHMAMPADRVDMIGGSEPVAIVTRGTKSTRILLDGRGAAGFVPDVKSQVAGSLIIDAAAAELVVRDHVTGRAWRLPGAPGLVIADPHQRLLATFDGRRIRRWSLGGLAPISIPRSLTLPHDDLLLFSQLPGRTTPLRAVDHRGVEVDRFDEVGAALVDLALIQRADGSIARWHPRQRRVELVSADALDSPLELAGDVYFLADKQLVRLRDRQVVCPTSAARVAREAGVAVGIHDDLAVVCHLKTGRVVTLQIDVVRAGEAVSRGLMYLSSDGSRIGIVAEGALLLFDTDTGAPVQPPPGLARLAITQLRFGRDSTRLAITAKEGVFLVEGEQITQLSTSPTKLIEVTPDDRTIVGVIEGRVLTWDVATRVQHELGMVAGNTQALVISILPETVGVSAQLGRFGRVLLFPMPPPSLPIVEGWLAPLR